MAFDITTAVEEKPMAFDPTTMVEDAGGFDPTTAVEETEQQPTEYQGGDPIIDAQIDSDADEKERLAASLFTPEEIETMKAKGNIGPVEAITRFAEWEDSVPFVGTGKTVYDLFSIKNIAERKLAGEQVTKDEEEKVLSFMRQHAEMDVRGMSVGGGVAIGAAMLPSIMGEFALTAGYGKAAITAGKTALKVGATSAAKKAIMKTASLAAMKASLSATPMTLRNYGNRRVNEYMDVTDKGELLFKNAEESPATTAFKSLGDSSIEIASELAGGPIAKAISPIAKVVVKPFVTAMEKLPPKAKDALFNAYRKMDNNATVSKLFSKSGWNGFLPEYGEERLGDLARVVLDLDENEGYSLDQFFDAVFPDKEKALTELGVIAVAGTSRSLASGLVNVLQSKGLGEAEAVDTVSHLTATEQDALFENMTKPEIRESLEKVRVSAVDMAKSAGVEEDVAEAYGQTVRANALWGASQYNIAPEKYFEDLKLSIQKAEGPQNVPQELYQRVINKQQIEPELLEGLSEAEKTVLQSVANEGDIARTPRQWIERLGDFVKKDETKLQELNDTISWLESINTEDKKTRIPSYDVAGFIGSRGGTLYQSDVDNKTDIIPSNVEELQGVLVSKEYGSIETSMYENDGSLLLGRIEVDEDKQRQGHGTKAMELITRFADAKGLRIDLTAATDFGGSSVKRLKAFYKRFGFIENKGKNKDFSISENMYRLPEKNDKRILYQQENRGSITFAEDGSKIVKLFAGADRSTLFHETGHLFLRELQKAAGISEGAKEDFEKVKAALGSPDGTFTRAQEEQFAKGFEQYLMEGVPANKSLESVFKSLKEWMLQIYKTVKGLGGTLNNDLREVFDKMLGGKELDMFTMDLEIDNTESLWGEFYRNFVATLSPIEDLAKQYEAIKGELPDGTNPLFLARLYATTRNRIVQTLQKNTYYFDDNGNVVITGEGFKPILDDFDFEFTRIEPDYNKRQRDLKDFLIARRYLEDLSGREDVTVTPAQIEKSIKDMVRLNDKYGEEMIRIQDYANRIYKYQKRVLYSLVRSGAKSQDWYDKTVEGNPNYISFRRLYEEGEIENTYAIGAAPKFGVLASVVKQLKGSKREVRDPFESLVYNTARILQQAEKNKIVTSIEKMSSVFPEYVQLTPPIVVKRGTTQVNVTYDAGLRRKLEDAISSFSNKLSREKSMRIKGLGLVRGSYSPMEKMVRVRLGSNEGTLAHEVGHMLDSELGLVGKMLGDENVKKELQELGKKRLSGETVMTEHGERVVFEERILDAAPKDYMDYITSDSEILANMFDAYVNAPDLLKKVAPNAKKAFEKIIDGVPALSFIKDIKPTVERAEEVIKRDVWGPLDTPPQGTIQFYKNGEKKFLKVAKPLYEAMQDLTPAEIGVFNKLLSPFRMAASLFRSAATLPPEFWVRNFLRDIDTARVQAEPSVGVVDVVHGICGAFGHTKLYNDWMTAGGGFNSYMDISDKGIEDTYKELFKPNGKIERYLKSGGIEVLGDLSLKFEETTRLAVFRAAKKEGGSDLSALLESRDATLDFSRSGKKGKILNRYIPFLNAGIQATDKMVRAFKKNPKLMTYRGIMTITIPSIVSTGYYLFAAPDDEREEFLEIPQWRKDMTWPVKIGSEWYYYPKPYALGYLFGSTMERFMTWAYQGEKPEAEGMWREFAMGIGGSLSPVQDISALMTPVGKVVVEHITNYNFFTGRHIYQPWMDKLPPEERANKFTSETSKEVGKAIGISPALIDNAIRSAFATTTPYILEASDGILKSVKEWNGEEIPQEPKTNADLLFIRGFSIRRPSGYQAISTQNFLNNYRELAQYEEAYSQKDGEEKALYMEENEAKITMARRLEPVSKRISGISKQIDSIYDDKDMGADDKVEAIRELEDQLLEAAKEGNSMIREEK